MDDYTHSEKIEFIRYWLNIEADESNVDELFDRANLRFRKLTYGY